APTTQDGKPRHRPAPRDRRKGSSSRPNAAKDVAGTHPSSDQSPRAIYLGAKLAFVFLGPIARWDSVETCIMSRIMTDAITDAPKVDAATRRLLCVLADCDPRTLAKALRGERVRGSVQYRI